MNDKISYDRLFETTYLKYSAYITNIIHNYVADQHVTEDLRNDVFLKLYERKILLDPECLTIKIFLHRVARNTAYDYLRRQRNELKHSSFHDIDDISDSDMMLIESEEPFIEGDVISCLQEALRDLPELQRMIIFKRIYYGYTMRRISSEESLSPYLVKKHYRDAISTLKKSLAASGVTGG